MKFLGFNKVLCISPHPDDVEYSMLGSIMKYNSTNFKLLQLAQGGDCDETTGIARLQEVEEVWKSSGCKNIDINFSDKQFIKDLTEEKWINKIETQLEGVDAIFIPNECDSHFEHRFISGFGKALIRNRKISLIQYYTPSTQENWLPNLYVDIKSYYNKKIECLSNFKSQTHRYYFRDDVLRAFHSDFQCAKKGIHYVEKYKVLDQFI